ncbi:lactonase family protein [Anthocerotibacter panamensis]|uniref:lactonase family protein n=1 Tax=Anthocerotibacter panamensis TaxID=2857077 RepID=UPI001C403999|nr:beta-propeller fold lactonase family protein [Anthocerotibacter panamensis]
MKRRSFASLVLLATLLLDTSSIPAALAHELESAGVVYTQSNAPSPNDNAILAYRRDNKGQLTPLSSSPFRTGGAGIGDPLFSMFVNASSDQEVVINPEHTRLFAVNSGSNTIAAFDIRPDGSLKAVKGSPFPSGGISPVSIALAGDFLYVVNKNTDPQNSPNEAVGTVPNYTGFRITPQGKLIPIPNSTISLPNFSIPTQALVSPDQKFLFGGEAVSGVLHSFKIQPNGRLLEAPNSPQLLPVAGVPALPANPLGLQVHPTQPLVYVGLPLLNKLAVYRYDQETGELTFLKTVDNSGRTICWLVVNRAGTRLYSSNTAEKSLSVYDLTDPETPVEIQKVIVAGGGGLTNLTLEQTNEAFLQVLSTRVMPGLPAGESNELHTFTVNPDGTLSTLPTATIPLGVADEVVPKGIAAP